MSFDYSEFSFEKSPCKKKLLNVLKFELTSFLGRLLSKRRVIPKGNLLHIGCGAHILVGYENIDFYSFNPFVNSYVGVDLRYPLPYESNIFDGAFSQHTIEHLYPDQAINLFSEVYRVLKPGAIFRCTVPDLEASIKFYGLSEMERVKLFPEQSLLFKNGCEYIWDLCQNWDHLSTWDFEMISLQLKSSGFAEVSRCDFNQGGDIRLLHDSENRRAGTMFVEAKKSCSS